MHRLYNLCGDAEPRRGKRIKGIRFGLVRLFASLFFCMRCRDAPRASELYEQESAHFGYAQRPDENRARNMTNNNKSNRIIL